MADLRNAGNNIPKVDELVDSVGAIGPRLARVSARVASLPFYVLPPDDRDDAIETTTKLFEAVSVVHFGLFKAMIGGLGAATSAIARIADKQALPASRMSARIPVETGTPNS